MDFFEFLKGEIHELKICGENEYLNGKRDIKMCAVNASYLVLSCLRVLGSVTFSFRISTILEICFTKQLESNVSPIAT